MWKPSHFEPETAVLRIGITGSWSVQGFSDLLLGVNDTYARINVVDFFARAIPLEDEENNAISRDSSRSWMDEDQRLREMFYGFEMCGRREVEFVEPENLDSLIGVATRYTGKLQVASISYTSPGWVELLGSLNPLKVIADAVIEWRKQNVERERIRMEADTERMRIRTEFAMEVLRWCESITARRKNGRDRLPDIEKQVLRPMEEFIARFAADGRISDMQLVAWNPQRKKGKSRET